MKSTSDVTAVVVDHGIFLPIARRLARDFRKVYYFTPGEKAFPTVRDCIGDGFDDIERVDDIWKVKAEADLYVFPDVGFAGEQRELMSQGKPVWGAVDADSLEMMRGKFLNALITTDLPVPGYQKIVGLSALRDHLRDKQDKYIKLSRFRGDWETMHWRDWARDELELDQRAVKLGPWKDVVPFYVFDSIPTENEDGCDTWCIDGRYPSLVIHGMEAKDKAYLAAFQRFDDLPEEVRKVNDAFGPILAGYGYRSFFSTEVRITDDGQSYFIDPTCRAPSPPSQIMCEMIGNLGEVVWRGAQGELVEPDVAAKFGVQAIVNVAHGSDWCALPLPDELDRWFKAGTCARIDGRLCFPPDKDSPSLDVGWLIGIGDQPEEAIKHLEHNIKLLPEGATCEYRYLADLLKQVAAAEDKGMEFSDTEMPGPEVVEKTDANG